MAPIEKLEGDLARTVTHEPDRTWPVSIKLQMQWLDRDGRPVFRNQIIEADAFFGRGVHGAPMDGAALIATIERMRREGPPLIERRTRSSAKRARNRKR